MNRRVHGFLQDEQGDRSLSRLLVCLTTGFLLLLVTIDVLGHYGVSATIYEALVSVILACATWAGAPRTARYFKRQSAELMNMRPPEEIP